MVPALNGVRWPPESSSEWPLIDKRNLERASEPKETCVESTALGLSLIVNDDIHSHTSSTHRPYTSDIGSTETNIHTCMHTYTHRDNLAMEPTGHKVCIKPTLTPIFILLRLLLLVLCVECSVIYYVSCFLCRVSCVMLCVVCHILCAMYCVSCVIFYVSCFPCPVSCVMYCVSCVMYYVSCIVCRVQCVMCRVSCTHILTSGVHFCFVEKFQHHRNNGQCQTGNKYIKYASHFCEGQSVVFALLKKKKKITRFSSVL